MNIVERLRSRSPYLDGSSAERTMEEAADVIERLREALQSLTKDPPATFAREPDTDAEVITKMRWIARRALEPKAMTDEERRMFSNRLRERDAEIERLRAALKRAAMGAVEIAMVTREAADVNNERLRLTPKEAYLQIVEGWLRDNRGIHFPEGAVDDLCQRIARRALEPKP